MPAHPTSPSPEDPIDILLVEDNPGDIRLVQEAFDMAGSGTSLHPTTSGEDALRFLRQRATNASPGLPDIVLLDLNLPGKDGREVLEAIRNDQQLNSLPVIILTSSEDREDIRRCYDANANAYLTKPRGPDEFVSLVNSVEEFWFERVELPPVPQ